jgi:hypothetical protein
MKGTGISFVTLLGLTFIVLKLIGTIDWSWLWVLAPFWGGFALALLIYLIYWILILLVFIIGALMNGKNK